MTINSNTLAEKFIQFLNRADAVRIDDGPLLASWSELPLKFSSPKVT